MTRDLFSALVGELESSRQSHAPVIVDDVTLRPYQVEAVESVFREWDAGHRSTLVCLPTGMGKSICIRKVIDLILAQ